MAVVGLTGDLSLITTESPFVSEPIYRGKLAGEYVYAVGSAPVGATDVIIVGYT